MTREEAIKIIELNKDKLSNSMRIAVETILTEEKKNDGQARVIAGRRRVFCQGLGDKSEGRIYLMDDEGKWVDE